jgi:hypothetical protein
LIGLKIAFVREYQSWKTLFALFFLSKTISSQNYAKISPEAAPGSTCVVDCEPHCVGVFTHNNTTYCGCQEKSEKKLSANCSHETGAFPDQKTIENPLVFRAIQPFLDENFFAPKSATPISKNPCFGERDRLGRTRRRPADGNP